MNAPWKKGIVVGSLLIAPAIMMHPITTTAIESSEQSFNVFLNKMHISEEDTKEPSQFLQRLEETALQTMTAEFNALFKEPKGYLTQSVIDKYTGGARQLIQQKIEAIKKVMETASNRPALANLTEEQRKNKKQMECSKIRYIVGTTNYLLTFAQMMQREGTTNKFIEENIEYNLFSNGLGRKTLKECEALRYYYDALHMSYEKLKEKNEKLKQQYVKQHQAMQALATKEEGRPVKSKKSILQTLHRLAVTGPDGTEITDAKEIENQTYVALNLYLEYELKEREEVTLFISKRNALKKRSSSEKRSSAKM